MNEAELDRRLGALLRGPDPAPDPAFVNRVLAEVQLDREIRRVRARSWRRAAIDCLAAAVVGGSFFLLSQIQASAPDGMIALYGPAMAGLIMLGLWSAVALPGSPVRARTA